MLNRLQSVTETGGKVTSYTFEGSGNRTGEEVVNGGDTVTTGYTYNAQNQLSDTAKYLGNTVDSTYYYYDNNGNEISQHSFLGWSETQSATTATYTAPGSFDMLAHNMTLYAVWQVNQYTVTYNSNGKTTTVIPDNVSAHNYGTITTVGAAAAATGFTYIEWNTKAD